jgi:hypothetical protein
MQLQVAILLECFDADSNDVFDRMHKMSVRHRVASNNQSEQISPTFGSN